MTVKVHPMLDEKFSIYGHIDGPLVMIGFGSIGRGALPLIKRHFSFDTDRLIVIDPDESCRDAVAHYGARFVHASLTPDNYRDVLLPLLTEGGGRGFCVNLSVDVSSLAVLGLCRELDCLYVDASNEPWKGVMDEKSLSPAARTNYAFREGFLAARRKNPKGPTAVVNCGANPGMVSWLLKEALLNLAADLGRNVVEPKDRAGWAELMRSLGVKGLHIAERDMQKTRSFKRNNLFVNTWSTEGMISEGVQPAELGWGTHEKWWPPRARRHDSGCLSAIYLLQPGANTRVYSWCPTPGPQYGLLVSHDEAISIADYYTQGAPDNPDYRPTCHYAYHPCNQAILSLYELFGGGEAQMQHKIIGAEHVAEGGNEMGVLLYGHAKNAYWYGSQLTIEQARALAPDQNATGLQVSSGVVAGMAYALTYPDRGMIEPDDMDFRLCLDVQRPYLGDIRGYYTDWNPLKSRLDLFPEDLDETDPWQFKNILVRY